MAASNSFTHVVHHLGEYTRLSVSKEEYSLFKKKWLFDAIGGKRYGEAFCEYFSIGKSSPLYFFRDNSISERWIEDNYLLN